MRFKVTIDVRKLPRAEYPFNRTEAFDKLPAEEGDVLFVCCNTGVKHTIELRNGSKYEGQERGESDTCTLEYDDIIIGQPLNTLPSWHDALKSNIISVHAEANYGSGQNIKTTEWAKHGCAEAIVRHIESDTNPSGFVYKVIIYATGKNALKDALILHKEILTGKTLTEEKKDKADVVTQFKTSTK